MNIETKKVIIFDLDGTLAPSKSPIKDGMVNALTKLLDKLKIAIISGGTFKQFEEQFLNNFSKSNANLENLYLLPTSGTSLMTFSNNQWDQIYSYDLTDTEKQKIFDSLKKTLVEMNYVQPEKTYGQQIEDRKSQITFSFFGQEAPFETKKNWDPKGIERIKIIKNLKKYIPEFSIRLGGLTSIDISKQVEGKAFGIKKFLEYLNVNKEITLFVGDKIIPSGNDYPAFEMGLDCVNVSDEEETLKRITDWLNIL